MAFVFLHTSDLHIGKPFGGFDTERALLLRQSRLSVISRLASAARDHGARHVLLAGDTFDQQGLPDGQVEAALSRFASERDIVWHIIPGNHDADIPGGLWERSIARGSRPNVVVHRTSDPVEIAAGVYLLPAPLAGRAVATDPTLWMDAAQTPPAAVRIGLAHGSTQGFGSERSAAIEISPRRAETARLHYLALGDWHGTKQIGPQVWYSGTPEPDQFADNDPGGALLVRLDDVGSIEVTRLRTAERYWANFSVDCHGPEDILRVAESLARLGHVRSDALVSLTLRGTVSLAARAEIDAALARLEADVFHLKVDARSLTLAPEARDFDTLADRQLRRAAERLARKAADPDSGEAATAAAALRRLFALASAGSGP